MAQSDRPKNQVYNNAMRFTGFKATPITVGDEYSHIWKMGRHMITDEMAYAYWVKYGKAINVHLPRGRAVIELV